MSLVKSLCQWLRAWPDTCVTCLCCIVVQLTPSGSMPISNEQLFEFLVHVIGLDIDPGLGGIRPTQDMERADLQVAFLR